MIARLGNLRKHLVVFQHLTGLTLAVFDKPAAKVVQAAEAAHRQALDRLGRKRAVGGGDDFDLTKVDQLRMTVRWLRQHPTNEPLRFLFGVSDRTGSRDRARCWRAWKDTMRMPDPGAARRKRLPSLFAGTLELAVVVSRSSYHVRALY